MGAIIEVKDRIHAMIIVVLRGHTHTAKIINIKNFRWKKQALSLFQLPIAA